jgi:transcription termination factor Rho
MGRHADAVRSVASVQAPPQKGDAVFRASGEPAIAIQRSGTRKEELLIPKEDLQRMWVLRKVLNPRSVEAMELLIERLAKAGTNSEFLAKMSQL